jgi:serine/threonine-protein kinase
VIERLNQILEGRYVVERAIGSGGMATVYVAEDVRHARRVAVKVLRPELAAVLGADRFLGEIRTTARLQHPHILSLFDSGESDGLLFFVTPYIEGDTLRDRLEREGQLTVDEAVRIACEVADALDYAHRQGVIHRDVKPANILLHDGRAIVADFGIALAVSEAGGDRITETGLSLGTPHYMSPEQATGEHRLDARTDIYALGCVLYEMLAGEPPHVGPTAQAVLARVLTAEPRPVTEARKTVPANVSAALTTALAKLPADRFQDAQDFAEALRDPAYATPGGHGEESASAGEAAAGTSRRHGVSLALNGVLAVAVVALGVLAFGPERGRLPAPSPWVTRVPMDIDLSTLAAAPTLSPDGRRFAWITREGIHVRALDQLEDRILPDTEGADGLFFSPDGRSLGYVFGGRLRIADLEGGPTRTLVDDASGGLWSEDGWIYFGRDLPFMPGPGRLPPGMEILRVREEGGVAERVLAPDSAVGFRPRWVTTGSGLLGTRFELTPGTFGPPTAGPPSVAVLDPERGTVEVLVAGRNPAYDPQTGHLLFLAGQALMAAPYDPRSRQLTGEPFAAGPRAAFFELSRDGTLWIAERTRTPRAPVVLDRRGEATGIDTPLSGPDDLPILAASRDGRRLVLGHTPQDGSGMIRWVHEHPGGPTVRLPEPAGFFAAWTSDGRHVLLTGEDGVYRVPPDASMPPERVVEADGIGWIQAVPGGGMVFEFSNGRDLDVGGASPSGDLRTLVGGEGNQEDPSVSPDGRWLAYESDETGRPEVYVRALDSEGSGRRLSVEGGNNPLWGGAGDRLFFTNAARELEMLTLRVDPDLEVVGRTTLFDASPYGRIFPGPGDTVFFTTRNAMPEEGARLVLVRNWSRELLARAEEAGG